MGSRLKMKPEEIYQFYAEIRWEEKTPDPSTNISIEVLYPTDQKVDIETTKQLNKFCFPTGKPTFSSPERFCFVLTDQEGLFRFGFCRYDTQRHCCMFLLSYLPWFDCFFGVLLMLQGFVYNAEKDLSKSHLPNLLLKRLFTLSLPPPQLTSVSLSCQDDTQTLQQALKAPDPLYMVPSLPIPSPLSLPALSDCQNIQLLYSRLEPETIISLFASLLQERRVIVYSTRLTDLTAVVHGANQLLYPLFWQHIFIPVLPDALTDYCCAPMPFLCGVPSQLMERVKKLPIEDVVLLDIDSSQLESPFEDHLNIPKELMQPLLNTLKKPTSATDNSIPDAFLHFFALLLGSYRRGFQIIEEQKIAFDQDMFKLSQPECIQEFLETLFQLQMFDQFIASRTLSLKNFTDDPFEQKCRNLKDPLQKSTSQKLSEFGDKFIDARDNIMTKIKDIEIIRSSNIKSSTNDFFKQANTNLKTFRAFVGKQVSKSSTQLKKAIQSENPKISPSVDSFEASMSTEWNEFERQVKTLSRRFSTVVHKQSPEKTPPRPNRDPPPIPPPYSRHREARSDTFVQHTTNISELPNSSLVQSHSPNVNLIQPQRVINEPKQEENEMNLISFESLPTTINVPSTAAPPIPAPRKHSPKPAPKPNNFRTSPDKNVMVQSEMNEPRDLINF